MQHLLATTAREAGAPQSNAPKQSPLRQEQSNERKEFNQSASELMWPSDWVAPAKDAGHAATDP